MSTFLAKQVEAAIKLSEGWLKQQVTQPSTVNGKELVAEKKNIVLILVPVLKVLERHFPAPGTRGR